MKKLSGALLVLVLIACSNSEHKTQTKSLSETAAVAPSSKEYFPEKATIEYAKNFTVTYHPNYKVVRTSATLGDWGAQTSEVTAIEDVMVLVQRGTSPPALTGALEKATLITIPATKSIATNSATLEIWIEMLDLMGNLVAVGGTKTYYDSLRTKAISGEIGQIGYSWAAPPDMEVLLDRHPDLFLMVLSQLGFNDSLTKLRQLGVPTATVFDWAEKDYLGRAEWIKYCALFFNLEKEANRWFSQIEHRTNTLKNLVANIPNKPVCLWGHYMDGGFWMAQANNAEARLLKDAGVVNPTENFSLPFNPVGEPFTSEEWLQLGKKVEHWIISEGTMGVRLPAQSYLEGFQAWRKNNLYHHYLRSKPKHNAFDWYNLSAVRPDLVLEDLIALFHPEILPDHQFTFFGKYVKETR